MSARPVSPDCVAGKCGACDGAAWGHDTDEPADCSCACHEAEVMSDLWVCALCKTRYVVPSLARDCERRHESAIIEAKRMLRRAAVSSDGAARIEAALLEVY